MLAKSQGIMLHISPRSGGLVAFWGIASSAGVHTQGTWPGPAAPGFASSLWRAVGESEELGTIITIN